MRIAWFANSDFQEGNAANSRIRALAGGLKENGNQVFLFFLSPTIFNSTGVNKKTKGFYQGLYFNYLSGSVLRSPYRIIRILTYLRAIFNSSLLLIKKRKHFDVIFLYSPRFLFFSHIYLLSVLLGIPLVIEKTELEEKLVAKTLFRKIIGFTDHLDALIYKYVCAHLIVISEKLKDHYLKYLPPEKITLIPIVVDLKRFDRMDVNKKTYCVGYLGSFVEKDGVPGIIQGFDQARKQLPGLQLKLIGFNPFENETNAQLKKYHLNGEVEKTGLIPFDEVPMWLGKCDVLIMNRTNDAYSHYGFPTKLGEYLATGIPTICSKVGDIEKYLSHNVNSFLIEPGHPEQLSEAILQRYADYDTFNAMGVKGKMLAVDRFDYHRYIPVLQGILDLVVQKKHH